MESLEVEVLTRKDVGKYCKNLLNEVRQMRDVSHCIDAAEGCDKESRKTKDAFVKKELEKCRQKLVLWSTTLAGGNEVRSSSGIRGF